jgi:hypothetical protein
MALTAGAGSIGCAIAAGAVGGAVSNLWKTKVQKKEPFTWKGFLTDTAVGAASGAIGGGALGAIAGRFAPTATAAASNAIRSVTSAAAQRASQAAQAIASAVSRNTATAAAKVKSQRISTAVSNLKQRFGSGCSFAGSTGVLMADGTVKAIDQVEPGDEVVATDAETGVQESKPVEAVHGHDDVMLTLVLTTGTGEKREILTTEDHPFWSESDQEFQRADELVPGELVLTADGGSMEVHAVETQEVTYGPAWNLTVQGLHTYSVIANGTDVGAGSTRGPPAAVRADAILVHNCNGATLELKYKKSWDTDQIAAADRKVAALNASDNLVVTKVERSGSAADMWRRAGNESVDGSDIDHIIELQLGGADDVANMTPLDSSVNRSIGAQISRQLKKKGMQPGDIVCQINISKRC